MGVGHDNNASLSCTLTEQYIMVSDTKPATKTYRSNPYKFSQCSVQGIREYLVGYVFCESIVIFFIQWPVFAFCVFNLVQLVFSK